MKYLNILNSSQSQNKSDEIDHMIHLKCSTSQKTHPAIKNHYHKLTVSQWTQSPWCVASSCHHTSILASHSKQCLLTLTFTVQNNWKVNSLLGCALPFHVTAVVVSLWPQLKHSERRGKANDVCIMSDASYLALETATSKHFWLVDNIKVWMVYSTLRATYSLS